jgi:hypothetical protein
MISQTFDFAQDKFLRFGRGFGWDFGLTNLKLRLSYGRSVYDTTICHAKVFHKMTVRKKFNLNLRIEDSVEDERNKFVQRINQVIFHTIDTKERQEFAYEYIFKHLCYQWGLDVNDMWRKYHRESGGDSVFDDDQEEYAPEIRSLTNDNFEKTLLVLSILYSCFHSRSDRQEWLSKTVQHVFSCSTRDLGVRWKEGFFYPSGAGELDDALIDEALTWLNEYPNEKKDYEKALKSYEDKSMGDVIRNCYSAIEGLARNILGNNKTLDNNRNELLAKIKLSEGWKAILANYITYAHNFRHASEQRHSITKQETEAYLYMTGLIIRLIIESK